AAPSASPGGTAGPASAPAPTTSPAVDGIQHATGAADVLLRMESGGGFVPIEFFATAAPTSTLYGDGTLVWRNPNDAPPAEVGNVNRLSPFLTIRLDEEGIQALLEDAIGRGGLGIAAGPYMCNCADIPSTTFTLAADGRTKEVSVTGLSPEIHPDNIGIVTSLAALAARLEAFAGAVAGERVYAPAAYRGVLMSVDQPFGPIRDWPWPTIEPADFASGENEFFMIRTMTPAEIAVFGIPGIEGGFQGLTLQKDAKLYTFALRPLLPDETK
ncbi:MAG: hypothetical protein ABIR64_01860, partial [Candidatus Limnocylindrales bacterium]